MIESERAPWYWHCYRSASRAYAFAGWRYLEIYRERQRPLPLAVAVAFVFLAEALIAIAFGRAWQASWWEWHLLMAVAFATIVFAARQEYRRAPSLSGIFGGIYLQRTLERLDSTSIVRSRRTGAGRCRRHARHHGWCLARARLHNPRGRGHDGCGA